MAIVLDGPVTPDALTAFVRQVPSPQNQVLNQLLPDRVLAKNQIDITELTQTNRTAKFRSFDARVHVSQRDVTAMRSVKLPALSSSIGVGEAERLALEMALLGGTNNTAMIQAIYNDGANLTREIRARMELARGQVLSTGKFTLNNEGGITQEADFGVPVGNFVTAGTVWSNTAALTITDLTNWRNTYIDLNGAPPTGMMISTKTQAALLKNTEAKGLLYAAAPPAYLTLPLLGQILEAQGLPPVTMVYDSVVDVDGVTTKCVPENKVIMYGDGIGYTAWGITATALELTSAVKTESSFDDAPGIVGVTVKDPTPPFRSFTFVDAVGMPIIEQPKRLMIATVL